MHLHLPVPSYSQTARMSTLPNLPILTLARNPSRSSRRIRLPFHLREPLSTLFQTNCSHTFLSWGPKPRKLVMTRSRGTRTRRGTLVRTLMCAAQHLARTRAAGRTHFRARRRRCLASNNSYHHHHPHKHSRTTTTTSRSSLLLFRPRGAILTLPPLRTSRPTRQHPGCRPRQSARTRRSRQA